MAKILFLTTQFPKQNDYVERMSKVMPQYAADHVSRMFAEGICAQSNVEIKTLNILPLAPWPSGSKSFSIPRMDWKEKEIFFEGMPYCNVVGLRQYSKYWQLKKRLKVFAESNSGADCWIVAYALSTPVLKAFRYIKGKGFNVRFCIIVPDLPQYMNMSGGKLYRFLKNKDITIQKRLLPCVDRMVFFSKYMNDFFELPQERWIVIEGMVDHEEAAKSEQAELKDNNRKVLLYTGTVALEYGIDDLIKAFNYIKDDSYELHIIGGGNGVEYIKREMEKNDRIKYLGVMERSEAIKHQQQATLLVNPRRATESFTRYSFPSKTLEYMMSGTPVIMHRLEAIPQEYDEFLCYFDAEDCSIMAKNIMQVCNESPRTLYEKGIAAKEFVSSQKSNINQMKKMIHFLLREETEYK